MLRIGEEWELSQGIDAKKFGEKFGISPGDIDRIMEQVRSVKGVLRPKRAVQEPPPQAPPYMPPQAPLVEPGGIGILPIVAVLGGLGILAYAFLSGRK